MVEHIRVQLEDQDKSIQEIHNSFAAPKAQTKEEVKVFFHPSTLIY